MNIFQLRQFNLILAILTGVLFVHFFKVATKTQKNDGAMTVLTQIISGISILALIPFFPRQFPTDWKLR
jgi:membrane-associated HD superfamily phosphohydrolase